MSFVCAYECAFVRAHLSMRACCMLWFVVSVPVCMCLCKCMCVLTAHATQQAGHNKL